MAFEGPPQLDIPDIKRVEKKRRRGFGWRWDARSGAAAGVRGVEQAVGSAASGSAASGARMAASAAAARSAIFSGKASVFGRSFFQPLLSAAMRFSSIFAASFARKMLLFSGLSGGAVVVAALVMRSGGTLRGAPAHYASSYASSLGALSSDIRVNKATDQRGLYFAGRSSQGKLRFAQPRRPGSSQISAEENPSLGDNESSGPLTDHDGVAGIQDQMERKYGELAAPTSEGMRDALAEHKNRFGMGLNRLEEFKDPALKWKAPAGRLTRTGSYLKNNQLMSNARGRRLDARSLHRLRRMSDYNPRMIRSVAHETSADVAEAQFSGLETPDSRPPPSPIDAKAIPSVTGPLAGVQCTAPYVDVGGSCGCPSGSVQTSDGCSAPGSNVSAWTGMLDNVYEMIDDATSAILMAAGIITIMTLLTIMGWYVTACSGGWLGWLWWGIMLAFSLSKMMEALGKADAIEDIGNQISSLEPGAQSIGDAVKKMAGPIRTGAYLALVPFVGFFAGLYGLFSLVPKYKKDLQDEASSVL